MNIGAACQGCLGILLERNLAAAAMNSSAAVASSHAAAVAAAVPELLGHWPATRLVQAEGKTLLSWA